MPPVLQGSHTRILARPRYLGQLSRSCPHPTNPAKLLPPQKVPGLEPHSRGSQAPVKVRPRRAQPRPGPGRWARRGQELSEAWRRESRLDSRRKERDRRRAAARPLLPEAMVAVTAAAARPAVIHQ